MTDLKGRLAQAAGAAFAAEGLGPDLGRVGVSDRPDLADFQCNGALAAAKLAKANPREIAVRVAERLRAEPEVASVEVAGPGFVNLRVTDAALAVRAQEIAADPAAGLEPVAEPRRVIVDYGGPNVAKPMHVGHLRASIIGESVKRLFRARGDRVWGDAHFGDWGFQMGLLIVVAEDEFPEWLEAINNVPTKYLLNRRAETAWRKWQFGDLTLDLLARVYPAAAARAKSDPDFRMRARRATRDLQSGRNDYRELWKEFVRVSKVALKREFSALNVSFDLWKGESDADWLISRMAMDLHGKGLLEESDGAQVIRVAREDDRRKLPPLLVGSSEGSAMYGTTDLATIVDRRRCQNPELVLYVVDQRQADHFAQVFRAAERAEYAQPGTLEHIGFGTMNGTDGKPFKTREGGVLKLHDLIEMAREKARERLREADLGSELSPDEFEATAHKVGVAALKFADLSNYRGTSYVFDLDRFTSFEGKTGPYLLYQAVRIKSLLRRAAGEGVEAGAIVVAEPAERELALTLDAYASAVSDAYDRRAPNLIAEHAYRLAQSFSRFYAACPVLAADTPAARASRLALAGATLRQLEAALDLLGIETPERM